MTPPFTRIDPDLPLCWEDAETLRVGFERAAARVRLPSAGAQRLIGSLRHGLHSEHLPREARRLGATPQEVRELLDALDPILVVAEDPDAGSGTELAEPLRTFVSDDERPVAGFANVLLSTGLLRLAQEEAGSAIDLVIHIERFLEPLERAQRWLSLGIPHLLIGFSDRSIRVGPLVHPDGAPCHTCATLTTLATDSALPVLAAQLAGTRAPSESDAGGHLAATWASLIIRNWLAGAADVHTTRAVFPTVHGRPTGAVRIETVTPHPDCACSVVSSQSPLLR